MIEHWSSMSCLHMILCQPCTLVAFFVVRRDMRFLFRIWHPRYAHAPGIFHHLFTGVPGELEAYWQRNQDLASKVGWPNVDSWRVIRLPKHLVSYFVVLPLRYPKKKLRTKSFSFRFASMVTGPMPNNPSKFIRSSQQLVPTPQLWILEFCLLAGIL